MKTEQHIISKILVLGLYGLGSVTPSAALAKTPATNLSNFPPDYSQPFERPALDPPLPTEVLEKLNQKLRLEDYLESINEEKQRHAEIIRRRGGNIMYGLNENLTLEQNLNDFDMYFPIWKAGEKKYGIPWYYFWGIQLHETTVSRNPWPSLSGHIGSFQLTKENMKKASIIEAPENWEMLRELPQRYSTKKGWETNDCDDVLRGGAFIRMLAGWGVSTDTNGNEFLDHKKDKQLLLDVIEYRYSAHEHGVERVRQLRQLEYHFE